MKRFKNILLIIPDNLDNDAAIKQSVNLAIHNGAKLTAMKVIEEPQSLSRFFHHYISQDVINNHIKEQKDNLFALLAPHIKNLNIEVMVSQGKVFYEIIRAVLKHDFDLVIKPCEKDKGIRTVLFGTTDMHLLRKCPCPVWLIKPQEDAKFKRILAAVDLEPSPDGEVTDALNLQLLEMSTSLAFLEHAELHIVYAWIVVGGDLLETSNSGKLKEDVSSWIKDQRAEIKTITEEFNTTVKQFLHRNNLESINHVVHVLEGDAFDVIPRLVEEKEIDLVLMGTIARTGIPGFFIGNTAEIILNQLNCSVLAIKPAGFSSPVEI